MLVLQSARETLLADNGIYYIKRNIICNLVCTFVKPVTVLFVRMGMRMGLLQGLVPIVLFLFFVCYFACENPGISQYASGALGRFKRYTLLS